MAKKLTANNLISFFNHAQGRATLPFRNTEMAEVLEGLGQTQNVRKFEELSDAITNAYVRSQPDTPRKNMEENARETLATLAYIADHKPNSPQSWAAFPPSEAYRSPEHYGPAMTLIKKIYEDTRIMSMREHYARLEQRHLELN